MAVGVRTRSNVLHRWSLRQLGAANDERHHAAAIQQHEPSNRAAERKIAFAVFEVRVPPHLLRERHVTKQSRHEIGQDIDGRLPALTNAVREIGALRCFSAFERLDFNAVLLRKADGRRRWLPVRFERGGNGRTGDELLEVALALGELRDSRGQAARRAVRFSGPFARQPEFLQTRVEVTSELRSQARQPARGDLLAADLDEQLAVESGHSSSAAFISSGPTYALAMRMAS